MEGHYLAQNTRPPKKKIFFYNFLLVIPSGYLAGTHWELNDINIERKFSFVMLSGYHLIPARYQRNKKKTDGRKKEACRKTK
jgi:hypothetical protein